MANCQEMGNFEDEIQCNKAMANGGFDLSGKSSDANNGNSAAAAVTTPAYIVDAKNEAHETSSEEDNFDGFSAGEWKLVEKKKS